jgi:predicted MPP superfamily phosphohydrolase
LSQFLNRRNFLKAALATGALAVAAEGAVLEPNHPKLVRIEIPLARLPEAWDGLKIAQLSDLHYDEHFPVTPIRKAVDIVNGLNAELVVLTGDFVTVPLFKEYLGGRTRAARFIEPCANLLTQVRARRGVLAILGNHDAGSDPDRITEALQTKGITVLRNRSIPFEEAGQRLWLGGLDDVLEERSDLDLTMRPVPKSEPVILLAHEPDYANFVSHYPVDLQLSGHSHGGQVRFPLIGAPYLPPLGRKYPRGLHRIRGLTLYTNAGIGTIRLPVRFCCPPEVTLFTLRRMRQTS